MIGRAWQSVRGWIVSVWDDIRASTDSSLLGVARFLGLLYGPIDRSLRIDEALRKALQYRLAPHVGWRHVFGGITYLLFGMLVVTGVLLSFYYRPSVEEAYASVQHVTSEVAFGWLIRDLHVWSANLIVIAVLAHMGRVFFAAAYKPPRETHWLIGLMLLFVVLAFGATGYLLPWDQWAYWTATEVLEAVSATALLGGLAAEAIMGDTIVSGATLSRFFALHVIVLPWIAFALLAYHFTLIRRRGVAPPVEVKETKDPWRSSAAFRLEDLEDYQAGGPFFPNHLLRILVVSVLVVSLAVSLAVMFPRPMADVADPYQLPSELVSTWVPVDVSLALIRYLGPWGLMAFTLLGVSLVLIPLFDRRPERRLRHRPVAAALGITFFVVYLVAWVAGSQLGNVPPSARLLEVPGRVSDQPEQSVPLPELGPAPQRPAPADSQPGVGGSQ
jgi:quinol-cytochrome oxidoreductase complex cytochrome b subunit